MDNLQKKSFHSNFKLSKIFALIISLLILSVLAVAPLHAQLTPARDLTGTWTNSIPEMYYEMDSFDPTMRMNDVSVTYNMIITQSGNSISIVLNINELSSTTDQAYLNEYGYAGVPIVGFNQIGFSGTVSGASYTADEIGASTGNAEHIAGTFTTDIITATLTGNAETTATNGIIVLRSGSSATMPPIATIAPTATPPPTPAPPTADNLASVSKVQGFAHFLGSGAAVATQNIVGTGSEIQTGDDAIVGFNYPDLGGTVYLGANSHAAWVYPQPQTDPLDGHISYTIVPSPITGHIPFEEGAEADEFGQVGVTLPIEIGVGMLLLGETLPMALGGAAIVEGSMLLGTGIAYVHEQLSPQEGTLDVRPIQVPQGMVMGSGTDYVVTVTSSSTTIQVIDGSVIFVDKNTNATTTVYANQVLTLPAGVQGGFSQQDLQNDVSAFNASTISQWWNAAPAPTATPPQITPTVTPTESIKGADLSFDPMIIAAIIVVIIIMVVVVVAFVMRRRKPSAPTSPTNTAASQSAPIFCPNCQNRILDTKGKCPFCNADLNHYYSTRKKIVP